MRNRKPAIGAVLAVAMCAMAGAAWATPKIGQPAPDFTVTTFGGRTVKLADLKGDLLCLPREIESKKYYGSPIDNRGARGRNCPFRGCETMGGFQWQRQSGLTLIDKP